MIYKLKEKVKHGYLINKEEAKSLLTYDLKILAACADELRKYFLGDKFDICSIVNGKSGKCSEDCKFCAQSSFHRTNTEVYSLLDTEYLLKDAKHHKDKQVRRYSIVTSGRKLSDREIDKVCESFEEIIDKVGIETCASHGLLGEDSLTKLAKAGVKRYHNNLETSRNYFDKICTTHTYDEKIETIKAAQKAGLIVCSGGIMGLGESEEDRIDMAFELRDLNIKSIPLNVLNYIEGTAIERKNPITEEDFLKMVAIYRFINPTAEIRLAGGRNLLSEFGKKAFTGGANATITGDMLTTCGNQIDDDVKMITKLGYQI